jgi:hypothetical protein
VVSKKKCHRDGDKPAIIYPNGRREWYINGKLHRDEVYSQLLFMLVEHKNRI